MNGYLRGIAVVVVMFFLCSNVLWAGGVSSNTISPDTGQAISGILADNTIQGLEEAWRRFEQTGEIDRRKVYEDLRVALAKKIDNPLLLDVYKKLLFVIYEDVLRGFDRDSVALAGSGERGIFLNYQGARYRFFLSGGEFSLEKIEDDGGGVSRRGVIAGGAALLLTTLLEGCLEGCMKYIGRQERPQRKEKGGTHEEQPLPKVVTPRLQEEVIVGFNKWLKRISDTRTGLPPSHVGDTTPVAVKHGFAAGAFTYDMAQLALRQVRTGEYSSARKIIFYFARRFNKYTAKKLETMVDKHHVYGILRLLPSPRDGKLRRHIINCIDTSSTWDEGNGIIEWYTDGGPQSWLGMAAVQLLMFDKGLSQDERAELENLVLELADTIIGLFNPVNIVAAGPGKQGLYGAPDRVQLGHIENMWDHYAFLTQLAGYFTSKADVSYYRRMAEEILNGLKQKGVVARKGDTAWFWQGFDSGAINKQIPTDVQAWGIASIGPGKLNKVFGEGTAEGMLNWLIRNVLVLTDYTRPDGHVVTTIGADFSNPHLQDIRNQRNGVKPQITDEWTAGVIIAMDVMANYYYEAGMEKEAEETLAMADALRFFALQRATQVEGMLYWEYSTIHGLATGYGWNTPSAPGGSLAGNQMLFAFNSINPFDPGGMFTHRLSKIKRLGYRAGIIQLLKRMGSRNKFSSNIPGYKSPEAGELTTPFRSKKAGIREELGLMDSSILKKISFYSARGENVGEIKTSKDVIGVRTSATWNCAEVSFVRYLDLTKMPVLKLKVKADSGAKGLRINVVDKGYLDRKNWTIPPANVQIEIPDDNNWHEYTRDLSSSGADITRIGAISFEVGTDTTGNLMGAGVYVTSTKFVKSEHRGDTVLPSREDRRERPNSPSSRREEIICSGRCPQEWGRVAFFRDGRWQVNDDDYFEVEVKGSGEYLLRLVGETQSFDMPDMYSKPLKMGRVYRVYFRDLQGDKENALKQIGINIQPNPWGLPSNGGTATSMRIKLVRQDRSGPKAWIGDELEDAKRIGNLIAKSVEGVRYDGNYVVLPEPFYKPFREANGDHLGVMNNQDSSFFTVEITKNRRVETKYVFALPLEGGKVLVTRKLFEILLQRKDVERQLRAHENFEQTSGEERVRFVNMAYASLQEQDDKDYFIRLWGKEGIRLIISGREIVAIQLLSEEVSLLAGHIGGEIMELLNEYKRGRKAGIYNRFSDVSISSLDATLLGTRLGEILEIDVDIDGFTQRLVKPGNTAQIVLGMINDGKIDLELIEKAFRAVESASSDVSALSADFTTKATLVLANEWGWEERRMDELGDIIGIHLLNELLLCLRNKGYKRYAADIQELLIKVRYELGRKAKVEAGRIKLSNPYLHGLIARIAVLSGTQPNVLLRAYYNDLIRGDRDTKKYGLVSAAVENALVEIGVVNKKGLLAYESDADSSLAGMVRRIGAAIYGVGAGRSGELDKPVDMALRVDRYLDPFGIIEDILLSCPFTGKINCSRNDTEETGLKPLLELLNLDNMAKRLAYTIPDSLKEEKRMDTLIIGLEHLFMIQGVDEEAGTLVLQPRALGIKDTIKAILESGRRIKIVASPDILQGFSEERKHRVIEEAVERYTGLETRQFPELKVEVKAINEVIGALENPENSRIILTGQEAQRIQSNRGAFIYVPQVGELLNNVITVVASINIVDSGAITDESQRVLLDYIARQIPGGRNSAIWSEIENSVHSFNNNRGIFFKLPDAVRFTEKLKELQFYTITVLIAA